MIAGWSWSSPLRDEAGQYARPLVSIAEGRPTRQAGGGRAPRSRRGARHAACDVVAPAGDAEQRSHEAAGPEGDEDRRHRVAADHADGVAPEVAGGVGHGAGALADAAAGAVPGVLGAAGHLRGRALHLL